LVGTGNWLENCCTFFLNSVILFLISELLVNASLKSLIFLFPVIWVAWVVVWIASSIKSTTCSISFSFNPRVVNAGVPNRIPEGEIADLSPGTVFLLQEIKIDSIYDAMDHQLAYARPGENVKLKISGIEDIDLRRGNILCGLQFQCLVAYEFEAEIQVL